MSYTTSAESDLHDDHQQGLSRGDDTTSNSNSHSNSNSNSNNYECFFPAPSFCGSGKSVEERKDAIATLASAVDSRGKRIVPLLQIVDLDCSVAPLKLLELVELLLRQCQKHNYELPYSFILKESLSSAEVYMGPTEDPAFEVVVTELNPLHAYNACLSLDELTTAEAFLQGQLDVNGDLIKCLLTFQDLWSKASASQSNNPFSKLTKTLFSSSRNSSNSSGKSNNEKHNLSYQSMENLPLLAFDADFDLFSPGIYMYDEEDMEPAAQRKLAHAFEQLNLTRGDTLLDIGCGFGGMMRYASNKNCHVTGITTNPSQAEYVAGHMKMRYFSTATVLCHDFFTYKPMFNRGNGGGTGGGGSNSSATKSQARLSGSGDASSISIVRSPIQNSTGGGPFQTSLSPMSHNANANANGQTTGLLLFEDNNISSYSRGIPSTVVTTPSKTIGSAAGPMLFDAISMMGVLEELGDDYDRILRQLVKVLRPGGRVYLDFAAETSPGKASNRPFVAKYIQPQNKNTNQTKAFQWVHLPQWLQAIQNSALVVDALYDNRHNYHLWATKCYQKLFNKHDDFIQQYMLQQQQRQQGKTNNTAINTANTIGAKEDSNLASMKQAAEFQFRLYLAFFAGIAASMVKQDYQCNAYRMILKLPEGRRKV